ncbi:hypothetical protein [Reichenbachiella versicolor]|uniref:hypothetical protein n=1 Tax=Reichenbachiella versicolor TaxID=1821036 RepID=UPI000D6E9CCA|nr:hypothetical protein [Reichenbachiella versicolor]
MSVYFDPDIKNIFAPYVQPMLEVSIATDQGTFSLDLSNYESVCRLSQRIKIAIEGYMPGKETAHPMPPGNNPLPDRDIQKYNDWLDAGMPEKEGAETFEGVIV